MSQLSDREIEEAAAEAGISPGELRSALSEQAGAGSSQALARRGERGLLPPSPRGETAANTETVLPFAPEQAVRSVKHEIEKQVGVKGHMQGSTDADVYDEAAGVVYRIQAESDGAGSSMVRVDIDPSPARGRRTLMGMAVAATIGLFAVSGLIIPGVIGWALLGGAVGLGALGATSLVASKTRAVKDARAIAAQAMVEAEYAAPIGGAQPHPGQKALPPGSTY